MLWGDTHLHTNLSLDARALGVTLGPEEAYRLARGEEITTSHREQINLSRPLDWLVISDHSDAIGAMDEVVKGNPTLLKDPKAKDWHDSINKGGDSALAATMEIIETFAGITGEKIPSVLIEDTFVRTVWERYLETAEQFNEPGRFRRSSVTNGPLSTAVTTCTVTCCIVTVPAKRNRYCRTLPLKVLTQRTCGSGWSVTRRRPAERSWRSHITAMSATV